MRPKPLTQVDTPSIQIPKSFDECQRSCANHKRNLLLLVRCRNLHESKFWGQFKLCMLPILSIQRREPCVQKLMQFIVSFAVHFEPEQDDIIKEFVENLLYLLLDFTQSSIKWTRVYSAYMISEIISNLSESVELSCDLLDELEARMLERVWDKLPAVRICAVTSLSRLVHVSEDEPMGSNPIVESYRNLLKTERRPDVRKFVVSCLPLMEFTLRDIVDRTADMDKSVRQVAYCMLKNVPLASLSISQRCKILHRGITDRIPTVKSECVDLLLHHWLKRDCENDVLKLLSLLDVEAYEETAEKVLLALFRAQEVAIPDFHGLKSTIGSEAGDYKIAGDEVLTKRTGDVTLLSAEEAMYWQSYCDFLYRQAEEKSQEAVKTSGAEMEALAALAEESREKLDCALPECVDDFVAIMRAHLSAGPNFMFSARRLLSLAKLLDFTDSAGRAMAAQLVDHMLIGSAPESFPMEGTSGNAYAESSPEQLSQLELVLNLAGDAKWKAAATEFVLKVHGATEQFVERISRIVASLLDACKGQRSSHVCFLRCLVSAELLLSNVSSVSHLSGSSIEPQEILHWLLIPGLKHENIGVRRLSLQCLGLYCLLDLTSARKYVHLVQGAMADVPPVQTMAVMVLSDILLWHNPSLVFSACEEQEAAESAAVNTRRVLEAMADLLNGSGEMDESRETVEVSVKELVVEGFAKLLRKKVETEFLLRKLLEVYFSSSSDRYPRIEQGLSVFFDHFCRLPYGKDAVCAVFIDLVQDNWPGLKGPAGRATVAARNWTTKLAHFMLAMVLAPSVSEGSNVAVNDLDVVKGQCKLAMQLGLEILHWKLKKSTAVKGYVALLCRILTCLDFEMFPPVESKKIHYILQQVYIVVKVDYAIAKDIQAAMDRLKQVDTPGSELTEDQIQDLKKMMGTEGGKYQMDQKGEKVDMEETMRENEVSNRRTRKMIVGKKVGKKAMVVESSTEDESEVSEEEEQVGDVKSIIQVESHESEAPRRRSARLMRRVSAIGQS